MKIERSAQQGMIAIYPLVYHLESFFGSGSCERFLHLAVLPYYRYVLT